MVDSTSPINKEAEIEKAFAYSKDSPKDEATGETRQCNWDELGPLDKGLIVYNIIRSKEGHFVGDVKDLRN